MQGDLKVVQGEGDSARISGEVKFLSHYARQLGGFLREDDLFLVGVDEGTQLNVAGFPGGYEASGQKVCGVMTEAPNAEMDDALAEVNWERLFE